MTGVPTHFVYQRRIEEHPPTHPLAGRLGRHVWHDSRRAAYPFRSARPGGAVVAKTWTRRIAILDQGSLGSCTGNAETGALGTDPLFGALPAGHPALDEPFAVGLYSLATKLDGYSGSYPPDDTGSDGQSVCKAAQQDGYISGYTWCNTLADIQEALQTGPVIVGVNWYDSFDKPQSDGTITLPSSASVRGGHEFELRAVDPADKFFGADNSWDVTWGVKGSFKVPFAVMERLLAEDGDCAVPVPLSAPAPVPTPTPDVHADAADLALASKDTLAWAAARHTGCNRKAATAVTTWAKAKGLLS